MVTCRNITNNYDETDLTKKENKNKTRKPDFCFFCETEIFNFARHITRNHSTEVDVIKILSKSKKKPRKKIVISQP